MAVLRKKMLLSKAPHNLEIFLLFFYTKVAKIVMQEVVTLVKGHKHWMLYPHASMASFLNKYGCISKENENQKSETSKLLEKKLATRTYKKFGLKCFPELEILFISLLFFYLVSNKQQPQP